MLGLLYTDDLVLCSKLEEGLKVLVGHSVKIFKRSGLKANVDKNKVMLLKV